MWNHFKYYAILLYHQTISLPFIINQPATHSYHSLFQFLFVLASLTISAVRFYSTVIIFFCDDHLHSKTSGLQRKRMGSPRKSQQPSRCASPYR